MVSSDFLASPQRHSLLVESSGTDGTNVEGPVEGPALARGSRPLGVCQLAKPLSVDEGAEKGPRAINQAAPAPLVGFHPGHLERR